MQHCQFELSAKRRKRLKYFNTLSFYEGNISVFLLTFVIILFAVLLLANNRVFLLISPPPHIHGYQEGARHVYAPSAKFVFVYEECVQPENAQI